MASKVDASNFKVLILGELECTFKLFSKIVSGTVPDELPAKSVLETVGTESKTIKTTIDGEDTELQVTFYNLNYDACRAYYQSPYRKFDGVMMVYDITKMDSLRYIHSWTDQVNSVKELGAEVILVGDNCHMPEERQVSQAFASKFAGRNGWESIEVSSKQDINIEEVLHTLIRGVKKKISVTSKDRASTPEEISQDPYALNLYEKALKEGTETDRSIRVNVVGKYRQGKTTLVKRLLHQRISEIESTNGIDVEQFTCYQSTKGMLLYKRAGKINDDDILKRLLTVTLSDEEARIAKPETLTPNLNQKKFETSLDQQASQTRVEKNRIQPVPVNQTKISIVQVKQNATEPQPSPGVQRPVLSSKQKQVFEKKIRRRMKTESTKNENSPIDFWDFGGQFIFYATHSLFHSRKAIYLLVFDLSLGLDQYVVEEDPFVQSEKRSVEYYLKFWMNSIHSFVGTENGAEPIVILVGTHKDKIPGDSLQKKKYITQFFDNVRALFDNTEVLNHIFREDFAIDNKDASDPAISSLRETIIKIGKERTRAVAIPAKWIQLEKSLNEFKDCKIITIQNVIDIDGSTEYPIRKIEQIKLFLRFHHAKGTLVYFDESPISNYVILDPQFLIDAFKCIITSERFYNTDPTIRPLWRLLQTEARLEDSFIDYQWEKDYMFRENKKILLEFLEKHRIITQARAFDEASQTSLGLDWFIVPSLLKDEHFQNDVQCFVQGKSTSKLQFVMDFQVSTIIEMVFHRVQAAVAGKWAIVKYISPQRSQVMIYRNACVVQFNNHAGIIEQNADGIRLAVVSCCPSVPVKSKEADLFRRFCESVVHHEFSKLKTSDGSQPKPYIVNFACNHEDHQGRGSKNYMEENASNIVPCPDLLSHDICVEIAKSEWYIDNLTNIGSQEELNERMLSKLSQCIGDNWELLGIELGLTQVQIDHLKADESTTVMKIYKMLLTWMRWRSITKKATLENFVEAVRQTPELTVDWDGIRNVADAIN